MLYGYSPTQGLVEGPVDDAIEISEEHYSEFKKYYAYINLHVQDGQVYVTVDSGALSRYVSHNVDYVHIMGTKIYDAEYELIKDSGGFYYTRSGDLFTFGPQIVLDSILSRNFECHERTKRVRAVTTFEELRKCMT